MDFSINGDFFLTVLTASIPLVVFLASKWYERRESQLQSIRLKKAPVYEEIVGFFFKVIMHEKIEGHPMKEKEMLGFFAKITPQLVAWGSDSVVKSFAHFRFSSLDNADGVEIMKRYLNLLIVVRKDLGHNSVGMEEDLVKLFLNEDPKAILSK